ncbi:MAG: hypothetical protein GY868_13280, partial [Deltaproteobacteria bacterium]|nr:hypothetical protein [Deltaproteobacteria bacterium]
DTKYSGTQTYWLTEGSSSGKRIKCSFGLGFRPAPPAYPAILEHKERSFYFSSLKNNSQNKFFGELVWTDPISILLATNSPVSAASSDALLEVTLQGASDATHSVSMILNDQEIGDFSFEGQTSATSSLSINHDLIRDGANTLILTSLNGENDISMVDTIRLTYQRTYTVSEDLIKCSAAGGQRLSLQGFTNDDITVVDITDPLSPLIITSRVSRRGSSYTAALTAPRTGLRSLYAVDNAAALHPERITMNHPSALTDPSTAADMIIISTPELMDSIQPLKDYRESQDYSVVLIDLEDIYDEFSFGNASPLAIKDFLFFSVKNWDTPPAAVLLIGDASYDPRNYFSLSSENLLPTRLIETDYLETASDDWFVDFDNDTLPDLAVGRIPAGSAADAEIIIDKIIAYESTVEALSTALAVAGQNDEFDYTSASTDIADMLRASLEVEEIIYSQSSSPHDDFLDGFNTGPLLINYIGHASTALWTGGLFAATDVAALSNRPDFPFVVSMTCLNGYFIDPEYASLAEILLNTENGGALAVWTSSGLTDPRAQIDMNKELLNLLLQDELIPLGEAVRQAKSA